VVLLPVVLAIGAYAVVRLASGPRVGAANVRPVLVAWFTAIVVLQLAGDGSRSTTVAVSLAVALVAAIPLALAARHRSRTRRALEERHRFPVLVALGVFVSALVAATTTFAWSLVAGDGGGSGRSADPPDEPIVVSTTTTRPSPRSSTTSSTSSTSTTALRPAGPTSVASLTTRADPDDGYLHVVFEDLRTTKGSVVLSFGNEVGLLIILESNVGEPSGDYRIEVSDAPVESADVKVAVRAAGGQPVTVYADGTPLATCTPGAEGGTCELQGAGG